MLAFGGMAAVMALDVLTAAAAICVLLRGEHSRSRAGACRNRARGFRIRRDASFRRCGRAALYSRQARCRVLLAVYGAFVLSSACLPGFFVPLLMERAFEASYIALTPPPKR